MKRVLVIHGPNLNLLGKREPHIYGSLTLDEINKRISKLAEEERVTVETFQSNSEGEIIGKIQAAMGSCDGLIINPAAYTHTSIGIRDAILLLNIPVIEIHLSNIYKREPFRHKSMVADVASAQLAGFGPSGYLLALDAIYEMMTKKPRA